MRISKAARDHARITMPVNIKGIYDDASLLEGCARLLLNRGLLDDEQKALLQQMTNKVKEIIVLSESIETIFNNLTTSENYEKIDDSHVHSLINNALRDGSETREGSNS